MLVLCLAPISTTLVRAEPAFYTIDEAQLVGPPGTLIRLERLPDAPQNATAYRIVYRSTGLSGDSIAVSGFAAIPFGPPPAGGRPIVAWAHPTSGVVSKCAPSLTWHRFLAVPGLKEIVSRGFIVVATDYAGLGVGDVHPFLVGATEAYSVLDAVRAARNLPQAAASRRFAVWGHSQGGHAALFAGLQARRYAPELSLVGIAAAAPATDLSALLQDDIASADGKSLAALAVWSWTRVFDVPLTNVVRPQAIPAIDALADTCIENLADLLRGIYWELPLNRAFLSVPDITVIEPWRGLARRNSPAVLPRNIPVFLSQGTADTVVRPSVTASYMARLCRSGSTVRMVPIFGGGHDLAGWDSASAAVSWIADRFDGSPAPSDCQGRQPVSGRTAFSNGRGTR